MRNDAAGASETNTGLIPSAFALGVTRVTEPPEAIPLLEFDELQILTSYAQSDARIATVDPRLGGSSKNAVLVGVHGVAPSPRPLQGGESITIDVGIDDSGENHRRGGAEIVIYHVGGPNLSRIHEILPVTTTADISIDEQRIMASQIREVEANTVEPETPAEVFPPIRSKSSKSLRELNLSNQPRALVRSFNAFADFYLTSGVISGIKQLF